MIKNVKIGEMIVLLGALALVIFLIFCCCPHDMQIAAGLALVGLNCPLFLSLMFYLLLTVWYLPAEK